MANLHIKKDESLKASLETHDIIEGSQRFSPQAGTKPDMLGLIPAEESLCHTPPKSYPFRTRSPLLPPKDNSSTFSARTHKTKRFNTR